MCVLRVSGKKFNPAKYLATSSLKPYSMFRSGGGFNVDVSRSSWENLAGQVDDAIVFLKKHRRTLARLRSIPEVEDIRLDFPLDLRIDRKEVLVQFDYFPAALVSLAGALGCGLELSIYPRDLERLVRSRKSSRQRPARSRRGATRKLRD